MALVLAIGAGCRAVKPWAPADLSQPGWQVQRGQAIWKSGKDGPEFVGELLIAQRGNESFLQFTKNPLPLVTARIEGERWQWSFVPRDYTIGGGHVEQTHISWLKLMVAVSGTELKAPWQFKALANKHWRLENPKSGESVEGFFFP